MATARFSVLLAFERPWSAQAEAPDKILEVAHNFHRDHVDM